MCVNPHRRSEGQHWHSGERLAIQCDGGIGGGGWLPLHRLHPPHRETDLFQEREVSILYIISLKGLFIRACFKTPSDEGNGPQHFNASPKVEPNTRFKKRAIYSRYNASDNRERLALRTILNSKRSCKGQKR